MSLLGRIMGQQADLTILESQFPGSSATSPLLRWYTSGFKLKAVVRCRVRLATQLGLFETFGIVPPEIVRYLVARTKMSKHIDFDTGNMLFEIADEYERLASNPPTIDPNSPRRKQVAAETALGALRMSQIEIGRDLVQNQVPSQTSFDARTNTL